MSQDALYDNPAGRWNDAWDTWDGVEHLAPIGDACYVAVRQRRIRGHVDIWRVK